MNTYLQLFIDCLSLRREICFSIVLGTQISLWPGSCYERKDALVVDCRSGCWEGQSWLWLRCCHNRQVTDLFFFTNKTLNIKWILFLYFINVFDIRRHMDFINVMTYDLHGPWEKITGHNSPLYARRDEMGPDTQLNIVNMATKKLFL